MVKSAKPLASMKRYIQWKCIGLLFVLATLMMLFCSRFYVHTINDVPPVHMSKRGDIPDYSASSNDNEASSSINKKVDTKQTQPPSWQSKGASLAREYTPRSGHNPFEWCVEDANDANGLLFIKIQKCASSTGSGISLTIAHNVAQRERRQNCVSYVRHYRAQELPIPARNKKKSLLWTIVRHPAKRALSSYFFYEVSQGGKTPSEKAMRKYLKGEKNFELESFQQSSLKKYSLSQIIQEMDFMAVAERMDESLVVFRLLNGFHPMDMIVLSSKTAGGYDGGMIDGCHKILPSYTTPAIDEYLSTSFVEDNDDFVLYSAANASLDKTIDLIGRDFVEKEVRKHQYLQKVADKQCQEEADFPCSDEGVHQLTLSRKSCFERDWGCGHECVYRVLKGL